jgi:hypothetical protein
MERSSMNVLKSSLYTLTLLTLVACGGDDKSSSPAAPQMEQNLICGLTCQSSIDWKIRLQGQVFPAKARVEVNGETVLDECKTKQQFEIDREAAPQMLVLSNYLVPQSEKVSIHIIDRGESCKSNSVFLANDEVSFEILKLGAVDELDINL